MVEIRKEEIIVCIPVQVNSSGLENHPNAECLRRRRVARALTTKIGKLGTDPDSLMQVDGVVLLDPGILEAQAKRTSILSPLERARQGLGSIIQRVHEAIKRPNGLQTHA